MLVLNALMNSTTHRKEYKAWSHAKDRCYKRHDPRYHIYGARGITMCDRWLNSFPNFLLDVGPAPTKQHTIERRNGALGYTPSNCIWATRKEQANNVSTNRRVEFNGEEFTLKQLAEREGVNYKSLWHYFVVRSLTVAVSLAKATKLGESRKPGERKFWTADISAVNRKKALDRWKGGAAAWNRA